MDNKHRWKFSKTGGVDQVRIETGADLLALSGLDQKLWIALSCPTRGLEFDSKTMDLIDTDKDGHIRVPEVIAAINWIATVIKDPEQLIMGQASIALSDIKDDTDDGRLVIEAARNILGTLGKPDASEVSLEDVAAAELIFSLSDFNGDGIVPAEATDDTETQSVINDIVTCLGGETDSSGKAGVTAAKVAEFFDALGAYNSWMSEPEAVAEPFGQNSVAMAHAINTVRSKIDDYFTRCALALFHDGAAPSINPLPEDYRALTLKDISAQSPEVISLPLSAINIAGLNLKDGINPAWASAMAVFSQTVIVPVFGELGLLEAEKWEQVKVRFDECVKWLDRKAGASVEPLGIERIRAILSGDARAAIEALIERDLAYLSNAQGLLSVERTIRYVRDLFMLANNFTSFRDFYSGRNKAIFQAGTLYIDGRSCELCIKVQDPARHAALSAMGKLCLIYLSCERNAERMNIVAALTAGDSDQIVVGRNGLFYDRQGRDWDATVTRLIDNPISLRQAFWSPYKRMGRMVGDQIQKLAAARSKDVEQRAAASMVTSGQKAVAHGEAQLAGAVKTPATPPPPFDIAKFAGIFAAIGLAVGAIGTALAAIVTGLFKLAYWQVPIALMGVMLIISGPSILIAWFKLNHRNLAPILDANGWAVNSRVKINIPFGMTLTASAKLPEGAERALIDPFASRRSPLMAFLLILLGLSLIAAFVYFKFII